MRGIGKMYRLGELKSLNENFREDLVNWGKGLLKRQRREKYETFWALRDIDLDIERGDTVGIIGRNGAGKSTMLKILSRITQPTTGELRYRGRLASLLEVGTGFHRELTGRENIYLNGAILGMTRPEIDRAFDAIVDFAGVEKFLDTPVKRYSSGMYVRLAFAVAAHLRTDILVVDEVLAVGDAEFQKKCLGKMQDVAHDGRTVIFVSHNMGAVGRLCRKAIFLQDGEIQYLGKTEEAIAEYMKSNLAVSDEVDLKSQSTGRDCRGPFRATWAKFMSDSGPTIQTGTSFATAITIEGPADEEFTFGLSIRNNMGQLIMHFTSQDDEVCLELIGGRAELKIDIDNVPLMPGEYFITLFVANAMSELSDRIENCLRFEVIDTSIIRRRNRSGILWPARWQVNPVNPPSRNSK
ncbi:MAG: ABC transporter ATP-binding protein [Candidatus Sumerlaeia bacterium]|nr:ABC transporter ATP-binding protein [Candidatus Sumerlaeia bacterium]